MESHVIGEFVGKASKSVKDNGKSFSVTLLPDPCFGKERYGEDFRSLEKYVDFFLVPLYDLAYSTTYWLETLAYGFFKQLEKPLFVELYAANPGPELKNLLAAMVTVSDFTDRAILATHDAGLAKEIQNRLIENVEFERFLEKSGCEFLINAIRKWREPSFEAKT